MSDPMTAPTTATSTTPRAPEVALSPARAARGLGIGRTCPVCGARLVAATDASEGLHGLVALLRGGPAALVTSWWLGRRTSCECQVCHTAFRGIPAWEVMILPVGFILALGALLGLFGVKEIATATGGKLVVSFLAIVLACASPIYAWLVLTRPWKRLAEKIARSRTRWAEEQKTGPIEVDAAALLAASAPGAPCPVCEKGKLEGMEPNPLWTRGTLGCPGCRIEVPATLTPLGALLGTVLSVVLLGAGVYTLWFARETAGRDFALWGGGGLALALGGLYLGFLVQGSGDNSAKAELERGRRVFLRRLRGLPVQGDAEEEPGVWFQENLEAVVVAFILALVIRHFVMEAFVIPTGSMAPTLLGDHYSVECHNCKYRFAVQKSGEGRVPERGDEVGARCPLCGIGSPENSFTFYDKDVLGGNKILVNKFIYKLEKPERYQVVVFKYPRNPTKNFIKRLVGLPGEYVKIDARGDVWVRHEGEKFALARKPATVQETLWFPVYDSRFPDPRGGVWRPEDPARWEEKKTSSGGETWVAKPGSNGQWLSYGKEIRDYYGYNKGWGSTAKAVGDVRVRARVTPAEGAKSVELAVVENERALLATVPVGTGDTATISTFTQNGREIAARGKVAPLTAGRAAEIALGYCDERVTLVVDGKTVIEWDDPLCPSRTETSSVRLGADPAGATFEDVKVDRDIYYLAAHGTHPEFDPASSPEGIHVPNDCYFMMGDNSPNSQDGREWGFVHQPHLIGRAFLVFWPLEDVKLIR